MQMLKSDWSIVPIVISRQDKIQDSHEKFSISITNKMKALKCITLGAMYVDN